MLVALPGPVRAQTWTAGTLEETTAPGWRRIKPAEPAPQAQPRMPRRVVLQSTDDTSAKVEAHRIGPGDSRPLAESVSDVLVQVQPEQQAAPAGRRISHVRPILALVELRAVVAGRISAPTAASCDMLDGDVLVCRLECEGGVFGLRPGSSAGEHFLVMGIAHPDQANAPPRMRTSPLHGIRLNACAARDGGVPLLLSPRGSRLATELRLLEQR